MVASCSCGITRGHIWGEDLSMARPPRLAPVRQELIQLLASARMSPLDDAPRLVTADWLEENGDASDRDRAAFIRLQCYHSRKDALGRRKRDLSDQEHNLLVRNWDTWLGPLTNLARGDNVRFTRGLIDLVTQSPNDLLKRGATNALLSEQAAWVDELTLHNVSSTDFERILKLPLTGQIGGLIASSSGLDAIACQALARCENLIGLHTLDLNYNSISDEGATALASSPYLGNLHHLDLWECSIGPEGAQALAGMRSPARPHWINLGGNHIGEVGIRALASSPILENVRRLLIWGNQIRNTGLQHLVRTPFLQSIEELYINENELGLQGMRYLASWSALSNVRTLSIWGNRRISRTGGTILCEAPMNNMQMLLLTGNHIGDESVVALANNPTVKQLRQLDLSQNRLTDEGVRALLDSPHLVELENLNLSGNSDISEALMQECEDRFEMEVRDQVP